MWSRFKPVGGNRDPSQNKRMQMIEPHGCRARNVYHCHARQNKYIAGLVAFKPDIIPTVR